MYHGPWFLLVNTCTANLASIRINSQRCSVDFKTAKKWQTWPKKPTSYFGNKPKHYNKQVTLTSSPPAPLQQDEFDYILSQCTDYELSECYQSNEPSNQRSTVAGEASSNYKAASSPAYSSPSHSACATSSRFILKSDSDLQAVKENAVPKNTAKKIPPGQFPFGSSGALIAKSRIPVCTVNGLYTCTLPMKIRLITGSVNSSSKQETRRGSRTLPTHSTLFAVVYSDISRNTDHNSTFSANHTSLGFARHLTVK